MRASEDIVVPHNGFEPEALAGMLRAAAPGMETGWRVVQTVAKNGREYDVCLLTGWRAG